MSFRLYTSILVLGLGVHKHNHFLQRSVCPVVREVVEVAVKVLEEAMRAQNNRSSYLKFEAEVGFMQLSDGLENVFVLKAELV